LARNNRKRNFKKKIPQKYYSKTKKMVTGESPTLLENIATGAGHVASIARAVLPALSMINTELKYFDKTATVSAYNPGTNDQAIIVTQGIAQGTSDITRIGNSILAKNIQIRFALNFPATLGAPNIMGIHCRAMLLCWKPNLQVDGPSVAKIFEAPNNLYSPVNKDNSDNFVVIKDKFFTLNSQSSVAATAGFMTMKWYKDLNWHMRYQAGSTADETTNHLVLILRSSSTGATNALGVTYYARLNYTDN